MKTHLFTNISTLLILFCMSNVQAAVVDLSENNFTYMPNGHSIQYNAGIVHYDLNTSDGGSGWVQLSLKQGLLATDDFRISLDYSNFNSGTENQGNFQIGFWSNSVQSAVKVQRGYDSYTAWRMLHKIRYSGRLCRRISCRQIIV